MPRRHRWEHLLLTPKRDQTRLNRIAQSTIDRHARGAFPSAIRFPIIDAEGGSYQTLDAYLRSLRWSAIDARIRHGRHGRCEGCDSDVGAATYHLSYKHIGAEPDDVLILLCGRCHDYVRQQQRVGRRYDGIVQPLQHWIWTTKQERERVSERRRVLQDSLVPAESMSPQPKVQEGARPRMGELILLFIDDEPLFLDVLDG